MRVTLIKLNSVLGGNQSLARASYQALRQAEVGKPVGIIDAILVVESQEDFSPVNVEGKPVGKEEVVNELMASGSRYFYVVKTGDGQFELFHTRTFLDQEETRPVIKLRSPLRPWEESDAGKVYPLSGAIVND